MQEEEVPGSGEGAEGRWQWRSTSAEGSHLVRGTPSLASDSAHVADEEPAELDLDTLEGSYIIALGEGEEITVQATGLSDAADQYRAEAACLGAPLSGKIRTLNILTEDGAIDLLSFLDFGTALYLPGDTTAESFEVPNGIDFQVTWTISGTFDLTAPDLDTAMSTIEMALDPTNAVPLPPVFIPQHSVGTLTQTGTEDAPVYEFEFKNGADS